MPLSDIITKDILTKKYLLELKSQKTIATELGVSQDTIFKLLKRYNLQRPHIKKIYEKIFTKEFLEQHFLTLNKTAGLIAEEYNTSAQNVLRYVHKYQIHINKNKTVRRGRHSKSKQWQGFEEISGTYINNIKRHAKARNLEFSVSLEFLWNLYKKQNGKCAISGVAIRFSESVSKNKRKIATASLDRIDSKQGYTETNIQWIHKDLQKMKWDFKETQFFHWIKIINEFQLSKKEKDI